MTHVRGCPTTFLHLAPPSNINVFKFGTYLGYNKWKIVARILQNGRFWREWNWSSLIFLETSKARVNEVHFALKRNRGQVEFEGCCFKRGWKSNKKEFLVAPLFVVTSQLFHPSTTGQWGIVNVLRDIIFEKITSENSKSLIVKLCCTY